MNGEGGKDAHLASAELDPVDDVAQQRALPGSVRRLHAVPVVGQEPAEQSLVRLQLAGRLGPDLREALLQHDPAVLQRVDLVKQRALVPHLGHQLGELVLLAADTADLLANGLHLLCPVVRPARELVDLADDLGHHSVGEYLVEDAAEHGVLDPLLLHARRAATGLAPVVAPVTHQVGPALALEQAGKAVAVVPAPRAKLPLARHRHDLPGLVLGDGGGVRVRHDHPLALGALALAADIVAVDAFVVAVPHQEAGVHQRAALHVDLSRGGEVHAEALGQRLAALSPEAATQVLLRLREVDRVGLQRALVDRPVLVRPDLMVTQPVAEQGPAAGAVALVDVLAHPAKPLLLALLRPGGIKVLVHADHENAAGAGEVAHRHAEVDDLDAGLLQLVLVELRVELVAGEPGGVVAVQALEQAGRPAEVRHHLLERRSLVGLRGLDPVGVLLDQGDAVGLHLREQLAPLRIDADLVAVLA